MTLSCVLNQAIREELFPSRTKNMQMLVIAMYGTSGGSFSVNIFNCIFGIVVVVIAIIVVVVLRSILTFNDSLFGLFTAGLIQTRVVICNGIRREF